MWWRSRICQQLRRFRRMIIAWRARFLAPLVPVRTHAWSPTGRHAAGWPSHFVSEETSSEMTTQVDDHRNAWLAALYNENFQHLSAAGLARCPTLNSSIKRASQITNYFGEDAPPTRAKTAHDWFLSSFVKFHFIRSDVRDLPASSECQT